MDNKKVVVVGATGALGLKITKALLDLGASVTALVRPGSDKKKLRKLGVKHFVIGDMMNKDSLKVALSPNYGFHSLVSCAAGYTGHTKGDTFKTDTEGYRNLVDATKAVGIPRFVLISILECDKAISVPHFYHKYEVEQYLAEKKQPYISLRSGAFLDQSKDFILPNLEKGKLPSIFTEAAYGTVYTPDLERYTAMAAITLPNSILNSTVDIGWSTPVSDESLAVAFSKVLNKPIQPIPLFSPYVTKVIFPLLSLFKPGLADMVAMVKWVNTGAYVSKNPQRQKELFDNLPTIEEGVRRYCKDRNLI